MSKPHFLHEKKESSIAGGKKEVTEEYMIHGDKGLFIKFFHQKDDNSEKIIVKSKGDMFVMIHSKGKEDKGKEEELSHDDLVKALSKHKHLKFALDYVKTMKKLSRTKKMSRTKKYSQHGGDCGTPQQPQMGGAYKSKSSKKSSKKVSKKSSKKVSKKSSKKSSKKTKKY